MYPQSGVVVEQFDGRAMQLHDGLHQAQAQTAAGGGAAGVGAEKAPEDLAMQLRGDTGSVVRHLDDHRTGLGP